MHEVIKRKWVELLRSGRYRQIRGGLRGSDSPADRCVIGVLQEALEEEGFLARDGENKVLELATLTAAGLTMGEESWFIFNNDQKCLSFPEFAERIEQGTYGHMACAD